MDKNTYERLKPYFIHLRRGYKGNYVYGLLQKDFEVLYGIYKELGFKESLKYTCNSCNLRLCKTLGKLYFEYEDEQNRIKTPPLSNEVIEEVLVEPNPLLLERVEKKEEKEVKKKRTRKKKEED